MPRLSSLLRDPLTHFLALGAALFAVATALSPPPPDERAIRVDRAALLEFIQFRSKAFEPAAAAAVLDGMTDGERGALIEEYVREEVLYREAQALDLDADDYVIRQRLVQKFDFLTESAIGDAPPGEEEIAAWHDAHQSDYRTPPSATFAHVYFNADARGREAAAKAASQVAAELNAAGAPLEAAAGKGDPFPFHATYVERTYDYVASQFGEAAADAIFDAAGPFGTWRADIASPYGAHAVFVRNVAPARAPPLAEVRDRVAADAARARREATKAAVIAGAIERYKVVVDVE